VDDSPSTAAMVGSWGEEEEKKKYKVVLASSDEMR
jgi:hypothetical protein